jgi:ABC-type Fe3+/spermidine/putrescine transport system ATPase subunit
VITLTNVSKQFMGNNQSMDRPLAVDDISLEIEAGSFVTLLGPSGCGKTTTLRMLAGLEEPSAGRVTIDGTIVFDQAARVLVPAFRRSIGMVFQSYAIWPHMTVLQNVEYPLKCARKLAKREIRAQAMESLELVGLSELAQRPAPDL